MLKGKMRNTILVMAGALLLMAYIIIGSAINKGSKAEAAENFPDSVQHVSVSTTTNLIQTRYTVQSGDTLYRIATKFNTSISILKQTNSLSSDLIKSGQVLIIPSPSSTPSTQVRYSVQGGDSLYYIAQQYHVSISDLKQANSLTSDLIVPGQVLTIPSDSSLENNTVPQPTPTTLGEILKAKGITSTQNIILTVDKSDHTLTLSQNGIWLKTYHVELGDGGTADKSVSGDHKTPEGTFYITEKSVLTPADPYLGTRWMRLSYPNIEDADRGLQQGLIDQATHDAIDQAINNQWTPPQNTALGGGIGVHGGSTQELGKDWTWGCVGLTSADVEDFFDYVHVGTPVVIVR